MDFFYLLYILLFVTMISLLVAVHEYGHFLFARIFKMDVEEFAIGFGRPAWTWMRKKGTEYNLRPFPLGGFVRVKGMMPEEDGSERFIENGFYSKPAWQRVLVYFAGPLFSILAGLAILIPLYSLHGVKAMGTTVGEIKKDAPAAKSLLQKGDVITAIDGVKVKAFQDMVAQVRDKGGQTVEIEFLRKGVPGVTTVVPELEANPSPVLDSYIRAPSERRRQAKMGVAPDPSSTILIKIPFKEAVVAGVMWPIDMAKGVAGMFLRPSTITENLGGPGTIVAATHSAARDGMDTFIQLAALLSISLGIMNLLPFGIFDGGQILMNLVEMLRGGKRPSMRVLVAFQVVGFVFIGVLVIGALVADVNRFLPK